MSLLDLESLERTALTVKPFEYCVVPRFVRTEALDAIDRDFPQIRRGGSFPLAALEYGNGFRAFVDELLSEKVRRVFTAKFGIDLTGRPATLTVRGRTRRKDGRIHADTKTKLITVLIYLNKAWQAEGGRLRLLASPDDMNAVVAEVPPAQGAMVAFRCRPNAWHGHLPFVGERRSVQLNWVTDEAAARDVDRRHRLSAWLKALLPR